MKCDLPLLLAPAGSPDALIAACAAGADAIYLGGRQFGARQFADNFTDEQLKEAVRYAHLRGIEVYVTVNTLITEREMLKALDYLVFLYSIGVDAVLIQDTGLLFCARTLIPDLTLHASTQMGVHNIPSAQYAAENGCKRIVLARELKSDEIQKIADSLSGYQVDLEVFVHGALCYAYSGRCLFSSLVGGRSGNRGMCAQPCRKQYRIMTGTCDQYGRITGTKSRNKPAYILSTKDLCLYPVLDTIVRLPVRALKIEGRMRSPEYVATVTSIYRKALDAIKAGTFHPDPMDMADLAIAFSRGFTSGYISGEDYSDVMGRNFPGNQGYYLGTVIDADVWRIRIHLESALIPKKGDGLGFISDQMGEGFVLGDDPIIRDGIMELSIPFQVSAGSPVFLTRRRVLNRNITYLLADPDARYEGSLSISCSVIFAENGTISVTGTVRDRRSHLHAFTCRGPETIAPAKTRSLTQEMIREHLMKTGGTLFSFSDITISGEEGWFAPIRVLNALRREILRAAEDAVVQSGIPGSDMVEIRDRIQNRPSCDGASISGPVPMQSRLVVLVSSGTDADIALRNGADRVYLLWTTSPEWPNDFSKCDQSIGIVLPGVMRQNEVDLFMSHLDHWASRGIRHYLVDAVGMGEYIHNVNPELHISSWYGLPVTNAAALRACHRYEFCTLSPELSEQEIADIVRAYPVNTGPEPAICCQGLLEAAVTEDHLCAYATITDKAYILLQDEKKISFPVWCEHAGRSHILNSSEHSLFDEYPSLIRMGIRWYIIDARGRGGEYAKEMTRIWKRRIESSLSDDEVRELKEQILRISFGGITRSGYRRGLSEIRSGV
ncbi:MAG TPA: U32 family peptidase [Methanospirillum sp.]|uniref:U32 family peptidase n=1 Tax=Methanospirillum sp. TaxID=45200 RepID=UPI002CFA2EBF|nr:U32 family peptidase [Methanospirillum sp.]HOJ95775.1 U32 family peptidase [Methanospirillum sp.]